MNNNAKDHKVALITGGGTGIGRGIALKLAEKGIHLALMGRRISPLEFVAKELNEKFSISTLTLEGDVSKPDDVIRVVDEIRNFWGGLDILVNNAGIFDLELEGFLKTSLGDIHKLINTNLLGVILMCRAAVPLMLENNSGSIVNIASTAGSSSSGSPLQPIYGSSKAAVIHLTRSLARILGPTIRVNVISPGGTTDEIMSHEVLEKYSEIGKSIALGRVGFAEDVARSVEWLISPESSYVSGNNLVLNGGGESFRLHYK